MQVYVLVSVCRERKMPGDLMYHTLVCSLLEPGAKLAPASLEALPSLFQLTDLVWQVRGLFLFPSGY